MSDRRPKDLSSLKHLILDREYPLNTTRFLDELVKRKLITKIEEEELRKMKYRKQIDEIFVILYKKNPKPTFNAVKDIMNEMDRTDFVDGESSPNVTAWCGFTASFLIGPYLEEPRGPKTCTVNGERYHKLLAEAVLPGLVQRGILGDIIFMAHEDDVTT
ncbi:unnamed protein product [Darwinula stevensoni]|uniref:Uncharacterized protein n=1 Tax=Darwinula stevensoni TaxID=69355 RepID=A0A7R9AEH0_9CRUS|nr:unnamed protein product [Darwinula stevensoni]CAG0901940.1 unnamed protein product [Darwinula stevensoni]